MILDAFYQTSLRAELHLLLHYRDSAVTLW